MENNNTPVVEPTPEVVPNPAPVVAPAAATPAPSAPAGSTKADPKTNAMIAWIFAPFSSYLLKDEQDEFVRAHARESFYLGIANIIALIAVGILNVCYGMVFNVLFWNSGFGFASLLSLIWSVIWLAIALFVSVPRIVGIIKANNNEKWTVPYVTQYLSKYIKF